MNKITCKVCGSQHSWEEVKETERCPSKHRHIERHFNLDGTAHWQRNYSYDIGCNGHEYFSGSGGLLY